VPKPCPECGEMMKPADTFNCSQADFICPSCAPPFVLARATSFTDLQPEEYGYDVTDN